MSGLNTRSVSRDSLLLVAELAVGDRPAVAVKVRNLSDTGMMGEGELDIAVGEPFVVDLRNIGKVHGRVAWARGKRFGLNFDKIVDPKLARAPVGTGPREAPRYARPAVAAPPAAPDARTLRKL